MKKRSYGRPLDGVLLLDKPLGMTSNSALQAVKRLYFAQKAGHTGSLDPLATGMLPLCFGQATRLSQYLLEADKHYQVTAKLGVKTTTADQEGEVILIRPVQVTEEQLKKALLQFMGDIQQIPSMYSALKYQGKPLYALARQGIEVPREARTVTIHALKLLDFTPETVSLDIRCSKGTYVRNLIEDLGEVLGCGAHVTALRRLSVSQYQTEAMVSLETLKELKTAGDLKALDDLVLPLETMVNHLPVFQLSPTASFQWLQGNAIQVANPPDKGLLRIYQLGKGFVGIGEINDEGKLAPVRLLA